MVKDVLVALAILATLGAVNAKTPDYILEMPGQPNVAVYVGDKEGFAIGCRAIRDIWSDVAIRKISTSDAWNNELAVLKISHIHCDLRTRKFRINKNTPMIVVFADTKRWHYVQDDPKINAWHIGIPGAVSDTTHKQLETLAPDKGVDLHSKRVVASQPKSDDKKASESCAQFPYQQCISVAAVDNVTTKVTYANRCSYSVRIAIGDWCNGNAMFGRQEVTIGGNSNREIDNKRSECSPLGGNTLERRIVEACRL